jgi:pimeloyl-ACP methyl ester carboxylesterase
MTTDKQTMTKLPSPQYVVVDGLRVRYATGGNATGRPVLLTSPWPESIIAFGAIWDDLAEAAPLFAVDLPGFGKSDGRPDIMNPRAMGSFVVRLVKEFSLDAPHAVCPDVGTPAILYAAAEHGRTFTSLTVGGGAMDERLVAGTLKEIVEAPDTKAWEGLDGGDIVATAVPQLRQTPPSEDELRDYRESYAGDRFVKSMAFVRTYPQSLPPLRALLRTIETPVQVLYGRRDPLVPPEHGELLGRSLPHVRVVSLDAGHFAWQDTATEYGAAVRSWIEGGYRDVT